MKKFSYVATALIFLAACQLGEKDTNQKQQFVSDSSSKTEDMDTVAAMASKKDSMSSKEAKDKMKEMKKLDLKDLDVAWTEYSVKEMKDLFCWDAKDITRVRFFLGGLDTVLVDGKRKVVPLIMMQLQRSTTPGAQPVYSYSYYRGDAVCPPPYDQPCAIETEK